MTMAMAMATEVSPVSPHETSCFGRRVSSSPPPAPLAVGRPSNAAKSVSTTCARIRTDIHRMVLIASKNVNADDPIESIVTTVLGSRGAVEDTAMLSAWSSAMALNDRRVSAVLVRALHAMISRRADDMDTRHCAALQRLQPRLLASALQLVRHILATRRRLVFDDAPHSEHDLRNAAVLFMKIMRPKRTKSDHASKDTTRARRVAGKCAFTVSPRCLQRLPRRVKEKVREGIPVVKL